MKVLNIEAHIYDEQKLLTRYKGVTPRCQISSPLQYPVTTHAISSLGDVVYNHYFSLKFVKIDDVFYVFHDCMRVCLVERK